jgi:hypothetical protein
MQTNWFAATVLAGSLVFAPLLLGSAQAGSVPDLKSAAGATPGVLTLVHSGGGGGGGAGHGGGGGGGWGGGSGGHWGGGMAGGRVGGMGGGRWAGGGGHWSGGGYARRGSYGSPRFASRGYNRGFNNHFNNARFNNRHFVNNRNFHNRRFNNRFIFVNGGWSDLPWWGDYDTSCWWRSPRGWVWTCS